MAGMDNLQTRLFAASREAVLRFIASGIHDLTVRARSFYDEPDSHAGMRETNEAIHRLVGHLRDLTSPEEPLTLSRIEGIAGNIGLLSPNQVARIEKHCLQS